MKRLAIALLFLSLGACASRAHVNVGPVLPEANLTFVADEGELAAAIKNKDTLSGVAIWGPFYKNSQPRKQVEVIGLVSHLFYLGSRIVFIYGEPLDARTVWDLLEPDDIDLCGRTSFFFYKIPTKNKHGTRVTLRSCTSWSNNVTKTEEMSRNILKDYWRAERQRLRERGYVVE